MSKTELMKFGGGALIAAALLNITRVIPMFVVDGVSMDNFPPHSVEDLVFYTALPGWSFSHFMGILSVPLLVFGFVAYWQSSGYSASALAALIGYSTGMGLYLTGLVSDGLVLPRVIDQVAAGIDSGSEIYLTLVWTTHAFATSFAGLSAAVMLISMAVLGLSVIRDLDRAYLGYTGFILGSISLVGYLTGFLNIVITDGLGRVGPLTLLMFVYVIVVGWVLVGQTKQTNNA